MKRLFACAVLMAGLLAFADGYETYDDFGGVAGDAGFWDKAAHPAVRVHSRTASLSFDPRTATAVDKDFVGLDTRLDSIVYGLFREAFTTDPNGLLLMAR